MTPLEFLTDHTYRTVLTGTAIIGAVAGTLGAFTYLRRQSLLGDVVSHSALPGALGAFLMAVAVFHTSGRSMLLLITGAVCTGLLAVAATRWITASTKIQADTAMAIVLTTFFGVGLLLLRIIANGAYPGKGGIQDYLFGNASVMTNADIITSASCGASALIVVVVLWKEFSLRTFDPEAATILGFSGRVIDGWMFALFVVAIVIGVKAVGVVLMIAFVVTPPAAARQWVSSLPAMLVLSGIIGSAGSAIGAYLSVAHGGLPTGPVIVLVLFVFFAGSLVFAPDRSVVRHLITRARLKKQLVRELTHSAHTRGTR